MPFTKEGLRKHPYNKCVICDDVGETCAALNMLCLGVPRICELVILRQDYVNMTNERLAEKANISLQTLARIKGAAKNKDDDPIDFKVSCLQRVVRVLFGTDTPPQCPATRHSNEQVQEWKDECRRLNAVIERKEKDHAEAMERAQKEADRKLGVLARALKVVSIVAASVILLMIAALVIDLMKHDVGFFWRG